MKSVLEPLREAAATVWPWPSSSRVWLPVWVRQVSWQSTGFLKQSLVGLEVEGAGEEVGVLERGPWGRRAGRGACRRDRLLDAGLLEAGLGEVLRGADEDAGAAADGGAEGGEVAAGFGGEEEDDLLGLVGDGDGDALFADLFVPGLDLGEPVVGGRVGGAAEEGGDEEVVDGLGGREVGMQPDACRRAGGWEPGRWAGSCRRG